MTHLAEIRVPEPQNNSKNNGTKFTRGHMGQIKVIRCFVQNFYVVAYVTKAGLGPEPEFALFYLWIILFFSLLFVGFVVTLGLSSLVLSTDVASERLQSRPVTY